MGEIHGSKLLNYLVFSTKKFLYFNWTPWDTIRDEWMYPWFSRECRTYARPKFKWNKYSFAFLWFFYRNFTSVFFKALYLTHTTKSVFYLSFLKTVFCIHWLTTGFSLKKSAVKKCFGTLHSRFCCECEILSYKWKGFEIIIKWKVGLWSILFW